MSPATIRYIVQEIRHERAKLTVEETWLQHHRAIGGDVIAEGFRRINFWRDVLADAETKLGQQ